MAENQRETLGVLWTPLPPPKKKTTLCFQPIWKYARQIGNHFPKNRDENSKKYLSCHHLHLQI